MNPAAQLIAQTLADAVRARQQPRGFGGANDSGESDEDGGAVSDGAPKLRRERLPPVVRRTARRIIAPVAALLAHGSRGARGNRWRGFVACVINLTARGLTGRAETLAHDVQQRSAPGEPRVMAPYRELFINAVGGDTWARIQARLQVPGGPEADPVADIETSDDEAASEGSNGDDDEDGASELASPPLSQLGRCGYGSNSADDLDSDCGDGILNNGSFDFGSPDQGGSDEDEGAGGEEEEDEDGDDDGEDLRRVIDAGRARRSNARELAGSLAQDLRRHMAANARALGARADADVDEEEEAEEEESDDEVRGSGAGGPTSNTEQFARVARKQT